MDTAQIHAASYGANVGQAAAAQLASLLFALEGDAPLDPVQNWYDAYPGLPTNYTGDVDDEAVSTAIEAMGDYVCLNQVEQGERLFRWADGQGYIRGRYWAQLTIEQRLPWETFVGTCKQAYNSLREAQVAIVDARRAAAATAAPATGIRREDSIFEEVDDFNAMRPEAVEAGQLYQRSRELETERLENAAWDAMRDEAEADNVAWGKAHKPKRTRTAKPKPVSAGETVTSPPVNRGGRGNKKPT